MNPRPLAGAADIRGIQELASRLWQRGWHPGGLGWALARGELGAEVVVVEDGGAVAGWAARGQHGDDDALIQADPGLPAALAALVAWVAERPAVVEVGDADVELQAALAQHGFAPEGPIVLGMRRLAGAMAPVLADGYSVRHVRPEELDERVEVHRAAWRPATLPWAPGRAPEVAPGATSSFTRAAYDAVRATWFYDADLDIVAVAPDGNLAGCCIAWFDPRTGVAEIEPLSVVPQHRRKGLAVAMCSEVARRVGEAGGESLFINTGPREEYPGPGAAYLKAGFEAFPRARTYARGS